MFSGKTLLITGGTGSFGNAVLRHYLETNIKEIRIFSRDEKKQHDMRLKYANHKIKFIIGDVRNYDSLTGALAGVNMVFHAAALKQVPSCEFYPIEAVRTNILGADNVMRASLEKGVDRVVVLSTDKAVYPINAMGMSKALMEKTMVAHSRNIIGTQQVFCGTRYGNVMASRGSVIPLFVEQVMNNQPLTVTDPDMTRFLMHLDEAVKLVVYAFQHGHQGDMFVRKAPAATMIDLATAVKELFDVKVEIKVIGTRHGEKTYETLVNREEMVRAKDEGKYFRIPADTRDLNYDKYFSSGESAITSGEDYHSHNTQRLSVPEIKQLISSLDIVQDALAKKGVK